jgi:hypothetical protein
MKAALREILADVLAVLALGAVIVLVLWFGGVGF